MILMTAVLVGCATLPNIVPLVTTIASGAIPPLIGADGVLSAEQQANTLRRLIPDGQDTLLRQHLAVIAALAPSPLVTGNRITLLQDGPAIDQALLDAIDSASNHINLETYILGDDEVGQRFLEALIRKRSQGVPVNLIYDSFGSIRTPGALFKRLRVAGIRILEFNPLNPFAARGAWMPNNRDHRKLLVVDGTIAITGGANIRKPEAVEGETRWRDTDMRVIGPVVAQFQKLFMQTWAEQGGETISDANYFPPLREQGNEVVRVVSGTSDSNPIYITLISAIAAAKKKVYLTTPYFVPDPQLLLMLKTASENGVDVRLVLPSRSDFPPALAAGRFYYQQLLESGVRIYERQNAVLHAKTAVIDGVWSTVGSANLDRRSFLFNREINAVILGAEFAQQMEHLFLQDNERSVEVDLDQWQDRPIGHRLRQWFSSLFDYWW